MDRPERIYVGVVGSVVAFLAVYFLVSLDPVLLPWYLPVEHRWEWTVRPLALGMDWYGRTLYSGLGAVLGGALAGGVALRWKPTNPTGLFRMLAIWMASIFLFATALFAYQLAPRTTYPVPLPPGYVAR